MKKGCVLLREYFTNINSEEVNSLRLSRAENRRIECYLGNLDALNSVTKPVQSNATSLIILQTIFDAVVKDSQEQQECLHLVGILYILCFSNLAL